MQTTTPVSAQTLNNSLGLFKPEWLRPADAVKLYGIGRSTLYALIGGGQIKSVCLRQRGNARGIRLISAASLSSYLESLAVN